MQRKLKLLAILGQLCRACFICYRDQLIKESIFFLHRPTINSTFSNVTGSDNITRIVWNNKTIEWTWTVYIFAVDNGNPKRGDYIPLTVTFSATCVEHAKVTVDSVGGQVHFRAPKMTLNEICKYNDNNGYKMFIQGAPSAMPLFQGSLFTNFRAHSARSVCDVNKKQDRNSKLLMVKKLSIYVVQILEKFAQDMFYWFREKKMP